MAGDRLDQQSLIKWLRLNRPLQTYGLLNTGNYTGLLGYCVLPERVLFSMGKATAGTITNYIMLGPADGSSARAAFQMSREISPTGDNVSGYSISGYVYEDVPKDILLYNPYVVVSAVGGQIQVTYRSVPLSILPYLGHDIPQGAY